jgi:hypothetical protein
MGGQSRQRPLSCRLCRVRKLRCSRDFPCSNCTTRGVLCQNPANPRSSNNHQKDLFVDKGVSVAKGVSVTKGITPAELMSRLERLETLVRSDPKPQEPQFLGHELEKPSLPLRTTNSDPEPKRPSPITLLSTGSAGVPLRLQRLTADAIKLERSCLRENQLVSYCAFLNAIAYCIHMSVHI